METVTYVLERYRSGDTVYFGEESWLGKDGFFLAGEQVEFNRIKPLTLDEGGNVEVTRIGTKEPWLVVPAEDLDNVTLMLVVVNQLVNEVPYIQRRSVTGWPPGSVGDISARIGYDWRELKMAGYSDREIDRVVYGDLTVEELLKRKPGES